MYEAYNYSDDNRINYQNNDSFQYTDEIYKALVDAIIPRTPRLAEEFGRIQYYGALDLHIEEYLMLSLDNFDFPIAKLTAEMLEVATRQLVYTEDSERNIPSEFAEASIFTALSPTDRLRVITLLEQFIVNIANLPLPFQNNQGLIRYVTSALNRFTLMGYYSEWSGYGSTRLEPPNQRSLEHFPISWEQVGYPGPSLGYHALRIDISRE